MGSISTVSSQTFKTYCFMAEKEGWRGEGEENRERGLERGAVERRNNGRGNNAYRKEMERVQKGSNGVERRRRWE